MLEERFAVREEDAAIRRLCRSSRDAFVHVLRAFVHGNSVLVRREEEAGIFSLLLKGCTCSCP